MNWSKLLSSTRPGSPSGSGHITRSEFEKDYDRIIFSTPFRSLQDKTQVFPLPEEDFVHNRLTHSLEVASVGRSLGKLVGEQIIAEHRELEEIITPGDFGAIVSAAALAHDVGNPPFGHSGEGAISEFFKQHPVAVGLKSKLSLVEWTDLINFEGNAQGYRLLNQKHQGLQLTYATLGAFSKYPRQSLLSDEQDETRKSQKKFGYFQTEQHVFQQMAEELGLVELSEGRAWSRHPLTFLVEAADDICYHIIDLEDGCTLGLVSFSETVDLIKGIITDRFDQEKLDALPTLSEKLAILRAMAINELIAQCVKAFNEHEPQILAGDFDQALTEVIPATSQLNQISAVSVQKIYRARIVLEKEVAGFEILSGLLEVILGAVVRKYHNFATGKDKTVMRLLPATITHQLENADLYQSCRSVLDFISGMTDTRALTLFRKLKGMSMPA